MFFVTYVGLCSTLRAVFPRVSKAVAAIFTLLYPFLDVLFGALDISQHLHELSLRLPSLGLKEKEEEIGFWESRGARQGKPPCGSCNLEAQLWSESGSHCRGRQPPAPCTAKPNWELGDKGGWVTLFSVGFPRPRLEQRGMENGLGVGHVGNNQHTYIYLWVRLSIIIWVFWEVAEIF